MSCLSAPTMTSRQKYNIFEQYNSKLTNNASKRSSIRFLFGLREQLINHYSSGKWSNLGQLKKAFENLFIEHSNTQ